MRPSPQTEPPAMARFQLPLLDDQPVLTQQQKHLLAAQMKRQAQRRRAPRPYQPPVPRERRH